MHPTPVLLTVAFVASTALAAPPAFTGFTTSPDGWSLHTYAGAQPGPTSYASPSSTLTPTHLPTDGHSGGYLRIADPNSDWSYFSAPAPFLGDHADKYGTGVLSFSQRWFNPHIEPAPFHHHVVLISGSTVLRSTPGTYPNDTWQTLQFPLAPGYWRFGATPSAPDATEQQIRGVLSNLTRLLIYAEFGNQVQEIVGLDSVRLALYGDANMNGRIDPDDLALTDRGAALGLSGWSNGDFNADGAVTAADVALLHTSFASRPHVAHPLTTLIPEPASLLTLLLLPLTLTHRRRHA